MSNKGKLISTQELLGVSKKIIQVDCGGSQKQFAEQNNLSQAYVSDVLAGKREPGEKFLRAIGAERVVCYRLIDR